MAKKTAKKPTAAKPKETWADGVARSVSARLDAEARKARGTVLPGENAARVCTADERLAIARVLIAAAYRVAGERTSIVPSFTALGPGRAVTLSVGVRVEGDGSAKVRVGCETGGKSLEVVA